MRDILGVKSAFPWAGMGEKVSLASMGWVIPLYINTYTSTYKLLRETIDKVSLDNYDEISDDSNAASVN